MMNLPAVKIYSLQVVAVADIGRSIVIRFSRHLLSEYVHNNDFLILLGVN